MKLFKLASVLAIAVVAILPFQAMAGTVPRLKATFDLSAPPPVELTLGPTALAIPTPAFVVRHQDPITQPTAGTTWSAAGIYRLTGDKEDRAAAGVYNRWKTFQKVGGVVDLELGAFGGATARKKVPVAAVLAGVRFELHSDISLELNTGCQIGNNVSGWCFGVAASVKF